MLSAHILAIPRIILCINCNIFIEYFSTSDLKRRLYQLLSSQDIEDAFLDDNIRYMCSKLLPLCTDFDDTCSQDILNVSFQPYLNWN